ncbi:dTMP kinase [Rugosimonospora africana]|uniref:Thymidylate kinase n=1 Tax=Rugosimonospora africana TaxID=556532 RepID=A0A8J3VNI9_9ACTN|nr:dTMP kinase [Rugosimonospora africana]GIH12401.1 dTMP kinase [Rugosimonospora africana]
MSGGAALKAILQIRPFRRLWLVLGFSSLGDWLGLLGSALFASQQVTGSAAQGAAFGSVVAVRMLPALVMGPLAGVVADRWDRRYTMVVCDLGRFVLFASIPGITLVTGDSRLIVLWAAIATFMIETLQMGWGPAKDASVPNLLPKGRLESANQLTLATTYGITPVLAGLVLAALNTVLGSLHRATGHGAINATHVALYFDALTFLATALTVFFGIKEISGRSAERRAKQSSLWREFIAGWAYVGKTPMVRGLVQGILCAFAVAGVVVGTAQFYARSLGGGESSFSLLFAFLFIGLALGIVGGPRLVGALSRRRWFGLSIVLAALSVAVLAFAWHLVIAVVAAVGVGIGAGMALLAGTTLMGREVNDDIRGRVFSFIQVGAQLTLLFSVSVSALITGVGGSRRLLGVPISTTRLLLFAAGLIGVLAGIAALRQMDDKKGVPLFRDLIGSVRGRPLSLNEQSVRVGRFIVFEGGEGAGKSTQVQRLVNRLRAEGHDVVVTREPGATDVGARIRGLLLDPGPVDGGAIAPRAEALLYAADRAHHVTSVVRPALARGAIVISDRYVDSSLAYQGAGRTLPVDDVRWLSAWATGGLKPDLVVLLDIDPSIGLTRVGNRAGDADRLEAEELPFHERVRYAFLDLASADPNRYLVLDASRPPEVVAGLVADRVVGMVGPAAPSPAQPPAAPEPSAEPSAGQEPSAGPESEPGQRPEAGEGPQAPDGGLASDVAPDGPDQPTKVLEGPLSTLESRSPS